MKKGRAYGHVEAFVVHFVEVEDRTRAVGWDQGLDYTEAELRLRAVF